jgi:hypothetical protein
VGGLLLAYIFIAFKQGRYIRILKDTNEQIKGITTVQSGLIHDFQEYRKLFNMEDIKNNVQLKLENQQLSLTMKYAKKENDVVQEYLNKLSAEEKKNSDLKVKVKYYEHSSQDMRSQLELLQEKTRKELEELNFKLITDTTKANNYLFAAYNKMMANKKSNEGTPGS